MYLTSNYVCKFHKLFFRDSFKIAFHDLDLWKVAHSQSPWCQFWRTSNLLIWNFENHMPMIQHITNISATYQIISKKDLWRTSKTIDSLPVKQPPRSATSHIRISVSIMQRVSPQITQVSRYECHLRSDPMTFCSSSSWHVINTFATLGSGRILSIDSTANETQWPTPSITKPWDFTPSCRKSHHQPQFPQGLPQLSPHLQSSSFHHQGAAGSVKSRGRWAGRHLAEKGRETVWTKGYAKMDM